MIEQRVRSDARASSFMHELMVLFKMRIVVLLLFAAVGGYFWALKASGMAALLALFLAGALAAMGSSALNEYIERDKDALMKRTKRRPLVTGAIARTRLGALCRDGDDRAAGAGGPALQLALALFLAAGAFVYVVIYTLWLKPRTSLNIVIGGAAGSFAVMAGGAAAGKSGDPGVLALALLLFFWTPIHFWALALVYREDYRRGRRAPCCR